MVHMGKKFNRLIIRLLLCIFNCLVTEWLPEMNFALKHVFPPALRCSTWSFAIPWKQALTVVYIIVCAMEPKP